MNMYVDKLTSIELVALTIYGEARGEPVQGQIAVGCVIRNRLSLSKTYRDICLAPKQFSCWNYDDPNRVILEEMAEIIIKSLITNITLNQCTWIAGGIVNKVVIDNTGGAKNYLTNELYLSNKIDWARNLEPSRIIGNHTFLV